MRPAVGSFYLPLRTFIDYYCALRLRSIGQSRWLTESCCILAIAVILTNDSQIPAPLYAGAAAPAPLNQTSIRAKVLEVKIVESTTLKILPPQPIAVLRLELLAVKQTGEAVFLIAKPGELISVYSKDPWAVAYAGKEVVATVSFRGDEHGGNLWAQEISRADAR